MIVVYVHGDALEPIQTWIDILGRDVTWVNEIRVHLSIDGMFEAIGHECYIDDVLHELIGRIERVHDCMTLKFKHQLPDRLTREP